MTSVCVIGDIEFESEHHQNHKLKLIFKIYKEMNSIDNQQMFDVETSMYFDVLPKIKDILGKAGITNEFYPKYGSK